MSFLPFDLLDSPRGQEVDLFPSSGGTPLPVFLVECGPREGFVQTAFDGRDGQPYQGDGSGRFAPVEAWRSPLCLAEQRGFGSPRGFTAGGSRGVLEELVGRNVGEGGSPKRRRRNWIKSKKLRNYAVGEDLAWDGVLKIAKSTLVGRVMGRQFAKKTVQEWARVS